MAIARGYAKVTVECLYIELLSVNLKMDNS